MDKSVFSNQIGNSDMLIKTQPGTHAEKSRTQQNWFKEWALTDTGRNKKQDDNEKMYKSKLDWTQQDKMNATQSAYCDPQGIRGSQSDGRGWKSFNNFEPERKFQQKQILRDEISNITMRILKAREAQKNMATYAQSEGDERPLQKSWKVGEVELMTKGFSERNRYFNLFPCQRKYGLKFVSPPVAESSLHQLRLENDVYTKSQANHLMSEKLSRLNQQRTMSQSPMLDGETSKMDPGQDIVSMLQGHNSKYVNKAISHRE